MVERQEILDRVRHALASEAAIGARASSIRLALDGGTLTMTGEVADISVKKLALEAAAGTAGVEGILDRLHVRPAAPMGDREIARHVCDAFLQESAFGECAIGILGNGEREMARAPVAPRGHLEIAVADGVVTLNGALPGLVRKRLAGVLAWWVPGSRDVINGIAVEPEETDSDHAIVEAVRIVLEKDPFVDASQIRIAARHGVARLTGLVPTDSERDMAGFDAWYVFGVDKVLNEIQVHA
ncbi:MAG: BON domain-containing protein [Alphaproteobacteria bacterium]